MKIDRYCMPAVRHLLVPAALAIALVGSGPAPVGAQSPQPEPSNPDPELAAKIDAMDTPVSGTTRLRRLDDTTLFVQPGQDLNSHPTEYTFYGRYLPSATGGRSVRGRNGRARYTIDCQGFDDQGGFARTVVAEGTASFARDGAVVIHEIVTPNVPCEFTGIEVDYAGNMRFLGDGTFQEHLRVGPVGEGGCAPGPNTLCLQGGRFQVEVDWSRNRRGGMAIAVPKTDSTGQFWFFDPDNSELIVRVLDGCNTPSNRFWVFAGGLTNVEVSLTVTDTQTGTVRPYTNPLGTPFRPIQDTAAFATCP